MGETESRRKRRAYTRRESQVYCVASFVGNMTKSGLGGDLANSVLRYFCCQCEAVIGEIKKNPNFQ